MTTLAQVKNSLGITGDYQNETLQEWYTEVVDFLKGAGVAEQDITTGVVARGVSDLWNYGGNDGTLSEYFYQRAAQLSYK